MLVLWLGFRFPRHLRSDGHSSLAKITMPEFGGFWGVFDV